MSSGRLGLRPGNRKPHRIEPCRHCSSDVVGVIVANYGRTGGWQAQSGKDDKVWDRAELADPILVADDNHIDEILNGEEFDFATTSRASRWP